ncbi:PE family protein [Mycobacterium sp. ML4]
MSYVFATPEWVAAAASDLASIGSTINAASAAAAMPTSAVMAAGADDISALIAALFGAHAQAYQLLSAQAATFHQQFVQLMATGAGQYATAEAANATPMQHGAAPSGEPALAAAAAQSNALGANRLRVAAGGVHSGGQQFTGRASALSAPATGSTGFFGTGGGGSAGALGTGTPAGVAPAGEVAAAGPANGAAFAPGFIGGAGLAQPAAQPAKSDNGGHAASTPHVQPAEANVDAQRSGWLYGDDAPVSGRAPHGSDSFFSPGVRHGLFGHSGAGGSGPLGEPGIAAPAR